MAYLVEVFRVDDHPPLQRRQSLLMIEDQLMIVMDLSELDLVEENYSLRNKDIEEFFRKYNFLSKWELKNAFQITIKDIVSILSESIPCVGCRRRVERLYYQLMGIGELALDPLHVKTDGTLIIREDIINSPRVLCSMFANHRAKLSNLIDSQPRLKKSRRCVLHSWDLYKSRPVTPALKDVWAVMREKCKTEVLLIDFSTLLSKLENYLKKHRFCADCRTKVMKAYSLLIEDCDPTKEKGFMPSLYQKIRKCLPGKHIHLPNETKYIDGLIARAEPELMGNRRERHAKTMEIAQEEVLTCVGICIYDRLRRIYVRLQEEEFTCRVLAAVAIEALCRNFEKAVEKKRGITQLELLCEELTKEELAKQQKRETKKLKKKRKKGRRNELGSEEKYFCECEYSDPLPKENSCEYSKEKLPVNSDSRKLQILDRKSKGQLKCFCEDCNSKYKNQCNNEKNIDSFCPGKKSKKGKNKKQKENANSLKKAKICGKDNIASIENNNSIDCSNGKERSGLLSHCHSCQIAQDCSEDEKRKEGNESTTRSDHSQDCGYSSEYNNNCSTPSAASSLNCSPEGSEVACSEGFCDHEGECNNEGAIANVKEGKNYQNKGHFSLILEEMLNTSSLTNENECYISPEEIQAFKAKMPLVDEKRLQLRQVLKKRFAQLCIKSQNAKV